MDRISFLKKGVSLAVLVFLIYVGGPVGGCGTTASEQESEQEEEDGNGAEVDTLQLTSSASADGFDEGETMAADFACEDPLGGNDEFPTVSWTNVPDGTQSFALTVIDTSTPVDTVHMVLLNIPASSTSLDDTDPFTDSDFADNYLGNRGYAGPCPPGSDAHNYVFTLYALNVEELSVTDLSDSTAVIAAIQAADIESDSITGTYP